MPSFKQTFSVVVAALVATVYADYTIQPSSVPKSTRQNWCQSELSSCPLICGQIPPFSTLDNTCDPV